jgi:hypothetical protein
VDYGSIIICYERQVAGDKFLRMSSLSSGLDWRHVRLAGPEPQVSFVKTKNSEARGVPLHERVVAELPTSSPVRTRCSGGRTADRTAGRGIRATLAPARESRPRSRAPAGALASRISGCTIVGTLGPAGTMPEP